MNGTSYHYNASGQRTGKRWPNGIAATSTYDEADRLVAIAHSGQIGEVAYGLNPAGLRLTRTQSNAGQPVEIESYTYDGADQLTAVGGPRAFSAAYDPVGNRTHATQGGSSTAYTANPVNQCTLAGQEPLAYDPNGNLTQMGVRWSASYDGANRLVQAQAQGNTMTVAYDAFHRPVTRTINGRTLHMAWDGWRLAEEREADATLAALYTHGQGPDEILSRTDAQGTTLYYHHDGLGNTLALTDSTGQVVERYSYDAFGKVSIFDAAFTPLPSSLQNNRFLFTGREWLPELNLYDYRNRVYSAELGRFLQTDPIRFKAGDVNLYRYCGNDSVNKMDPDGFKECPTAPQTKSNCATCPTDDKSIGECLACCAVECTKIPPNEPHQFGGCRALCSDIEARKAKMRVVKEALDRTRKAVKDAYEAVKNAFK